MRTNDGSSVEDYYEPSTEMDGSIIKVLPRDHSLEVIAHELILIRFLLSERLH